MDVRFDQNKQIKLQILVVVVSFAGCTLPQHKKTENHKKTHRSDMLS